METPSTRKDSRALPSPTGPEQAQVRIISMEISTRRTGYREISDEELEIIEMRYRQAQALTNLEDLFTHGQLDCIGAA